MSSNSITFNEFVEQSSLEDLKSWLLTSFEESNFRPFYLGFEPSAAVQLKYAFAELTPRSQERFKKATIKATSEWSLAANHKPKTLEQLVRLAAYIRASGIIDVLRDLVESDALTGLKTMTMDDQPINAYKDVVLRIVAVLKGFAPLSEAKIALERLFYDDSFDYQFAAHLFLGLCKCTPDRYTDYVPRFLDFQESHPTYYSMPRTMNGLVARVSLRTIGENFSKIGENFSNRNRQQWQERFLKFLCDESWSPAKITLFNYDSKTIDIVEKKLLRDPSKPTQEVSLSLDFLSLDFDQRGQDDQDIGNQEREPVSSDQDDQKMKRIDEDHTGSAVGSMRPSLRI